MFKAIEDSKAQNNEQVLLLTEGPFVGTRFCFDTVKFVEEEDSCRVLFTYKIFESAIKENDLISNSEFNRTLGCVLEKLLAIRTLAYETQRGLSDDNTNDDSKEPYYE